MAVEHLFNNKTAVEPNVYTATKSGVENAPATASYGNVVLIDTGSGANGVTLAGIDGVNANGVTALHTFNSFEDFKAAVSGNLLEIGQRLFHPNGIQNPDVKGAPSVTLVRAATTVGAKMELTLASTAKLTITTKAEGLGANGVLASGHVLQGYGFRLVASTDYAGYYHLEVYKGTGVLGKPQLVYRSGYAQTLNTIMAYALTSATFNEQFKISLSSAGSTTITAPDFATYTAVKVATGGTETYDVDGTLVDKVLEVLDEADFTFILSDKYNADADSTENLKYVGFAKSGKFKRFVVIGGGNTRAELTSVSIPAAELLDTSNAILVHGGFEYIDRRYNYADNRTSFHMAATVLGRIAGLAPQVPVTSKVIGIDGLGANALTEKERIKAIEKGVCHVKYDAEFGGYVVNIGINTLQDNKNMVSEDGQSPYIQVEAIGSQLMKELFINAKTKLLKKENGNNRNTLSEAEAENFVKKELSARIATQFEDNLILSYENVLAKFKGDGVYVTFGYVPNYEVNKMFITSILLDPNA